MHRTTHGLRDAVLVIVLTAGLAAGLTGCAPPGARPSDRIAGATETTSAAPEGRAEPTTPAPPTAADVRASGVPLTSGALTLTVRVEVPSAELAVEPQADGSVAATVPVWARTIAPALVATLAAPEGAVFDVQVDGSVAVRDAAGAFLGGLAAPVATSDDSARLRSTWAAVGPDVLTLTAAPGDGAESFTGKADARVWLGTAVLESATWGEREGGRSLAVDPTPWARAGGLAAQDGTWAAVVAQEPEAGTNGMRDQFLCHAVGAPDKDTWNLEPWRPDAGSLATLAARCNPE